jgi:hypothetical protein
MRTAPPGAVFLGAVRIRRWLALAAWLLPGPSALAAISIAASPIASLTYQLDCVSSVVPVCGARHAFLELWPDVRGLQASASAQMFLAHVFAYSPSSGVHVGESPPAPCTAMNVFLSRSYWCTDATCTTSLSVMKL